MRPARLLKLAVLLIAVIFYQSAYAQQLTDTSWQNTKKNIVRYNISGALLFGFDKYVILGYERIIKPNQSISINAGSVALPKLVSIITDSFELNSDIKNRGYNLSVDYRFYLKRENKYNAPRGVYIGPYYSFNSFDRENSWEFLATGSNKLATSTTKFNIHTFGAELGYQFILWNKLALDFVMVGPGLSSYKLNTKIDGNLTGEEKEQLRDAVQQLIQQKFPGMNFVFAEKEINSSGVLNTWSIGFRYLVHIGFNF